MTDTQTFSDSERTMSAHPELKTRPALDSQDYDAQADYISMAIASEPDRHKGMKSAHEAYVEDEENLELKKFGKMLLLAPYIAHEQKLYADLSTRDASLKSQGARLSSEEYDAKGRSARKMCAYNQLLGDMIAGNEEAMPRKELVGWLARAAGNNKEWAAKLVAGVAGEIAAGKLLAQVPGIEDLRHGDLDEDIAGKDYVFSPTRRHKSSVDVKTGRKMAGGPAVREFGPNSRSMILYIDRNHLAENGYEIDEQYVPAYLEELAQVL